MWKCWIRFCNDFIEIDLILIFLQNFVCSSPKEWSHKNWATTKNRKTFDLVWSLNENKIPVLSYPSNERLICVRFRLYILQIEENLFVYLLLNYIIGLFIYICKMDMFLLCIVRKSYTTRMYCYCRLKHQVISIYL